MTEVPQALADAKADYDAKRDEMADIRRQQTELRERADALFLPLHHAEARYNKVRDAFCTAALEGMEQP